MTRPCFYDLSEAIEQRFDSEHATANDVRCARAIIGTAVDVSRRATKPLPPEALDALSSAERYLDGELSSAQLAQVRVRLWRHLGDRSCDFADPEVNAVRLVLCATYDTWERGHLFEGLMAMWDFALAAGVPYDSLGEILRSRFKGLVADC